MAIPKCGGCAKRREWIIKWVGIARERARRVTGTQGNTVRTAEDQQPANATDRGSR